MKGVDGLSRLLFLGLVICVCGASCGEKPAVQRTSPRGNSSVPVALPSPVAPERGEVVVFSEGRPPWRVSVEVARTGPQRAKGLMGRKELGSDQGMLFIFERSQRHHFYMKNTLIPLDILFFSGDRGEVSVVGILEDMRPFDETPRSVEARSYAALEVRASLAKRHGIKVGDRVMLEFIAPSASGAERKR